MCHLQRGAGSFFPKEATFLLCKIYKDHILDIGCSYISIFFFLQSCTLIENLFANGPNGW